jgi:polysaccharide chain length determinant protein (PEP-CTERM system associated)
MHELLAQIENHVRMASRYRWYGLAAALVVCLVGWTVVLLMPDQYRASAKVYLDTSSMLTPVLRGIAIDSASRLSSINMIRRTLLTRPNLEAVARSADMDLKARTPLDLEASVDELASDLSFAAESRSNDIYRISYSNENPQLANRVVESLLNLLVEKSLGESRKDSRATRDFLTQQIREHESRLQEAEARLQRFKQENMGLMPGSGESYFGRKQAQAAQIQEAVLELQEAQRRRDEVKSQLESVDQTIEQSSSAYATAVSHPLDARIEALESSLDQMLLRYTDQHPDVLAARKLLATLQEQRSRELAASGGGGGGGKAGRADNPLYQQMTMVLSNAEAEVAALEARVEEFKRREQELGKMVERALEVEAEEARLNRDYDAIKRNHAALVQRLEALNISDEAAKSSDAFKFNVVEPPRVPSEPSSPNRLMLNAAVLGVGLGGGAGLAWLLGMLRPAVYSREMLLELTDIPVLGSISRVLSGAEVHQHRVRVALFAAGCVALVAGFGVILLFEPQLMKGLSHVRDLAVQTL